MQSVFFSNPAVLCAAGKNAEELWNSVVTGNQIGIKKVTALNGKEFYSARVDEELVKNPGSSKYDMHIMRLEEKCLEQIETQISKVITLYGSERVGICVGSCDNGTEFSIAGHRVFFEKGAFEKDYSLEIQGADYVSTFIAEKYGIKGPALTFSTACSSSAGAIIKAAELIRAGICDAVIAGGVDIASDTVLMGFDSLEAVSSQVTNPFSKNRHGITLGEAAAFFVLSKEDFDNTEIELLGYGESADAYHMTSPDPSGKGAAEAMKKALNFANLKPDDIDYVNLHGTGTKFNDSMEGKAVDYVFGQKKVPVSTTKAETGHTLGAAGSLEAAVCFMAIKKNKGLQTEQIRLPVQVWDGEQDSEIPELNIVDKINSGNCTKVKICMSNSFAFGGSNACLILGNKG